MKRSRKLVTESSWDEFENFYVRLQRETQYDSGIHLRIEDDENGKVSIVMTFDDMYQWDDDVLSGDILLNQDSELNRWIMRFD